MRIGSIIPPYPRLFDSRRRPGQSRASRVSSPIVVIADEEPTEEQLADYWESWNLYTVENPIVQTLNKGFGWTGNWVSREDGIRSTLTDDFESYSAEDPVSSTLNGGTGWTGAWTLTSKT